MDRLSAFIFTIAKGMEAVRRGWGGGGPRSVLHKEEGRRVHARRQPVDRGQDGGGGHREKELIRRQGEDGVSPILPLMAYRSGESGGFGRKDKQPSVEVGSR